MSYIDPYYEENTDGFVSDYNLNDFDDYDQREEAMDDYLLTKTSEIIERIVGEEVPSDKKEQLSESLSYILQKAENKIMNRLNIYNYQPRDYPSAPEPTPRVNIMLGPSFPQDFPYMQNALPFQSQIPISPQAPVNPQIPINPQFPFTPQFQNPQLNPLINQPQIPPFDPLNFNQPLMPILPPIKKSKHKKKGKKNEKDEKEKKIKKKEDKKKKKSEKKYEDKKSTKEDEKQKDTKKDEPISNIKVFTSTSGTKGILNYLTEKTGGNIQENGTIEVTTDSQLQITGPSSGADRYSPKYVVNSMNNSSRSFYAAEKGNSHFWLCFDFKSMKVEISSYAIKNTQYANVANIKNWVIEISDDGQSWTQIDNHINCQFFKASSTTKSFNVTNSRFARYCRFRHTGDFWNPKFNPSSRSNSGSLSENSYVGIQCFEFFGKLQET